MKWWKIIPGLAGLAVLVVIGYAAYVFLTYSRIEDRVVLEPAGEAVEPVRTGREYTAVSYNAGFGAYTADFTFFMDGGKESRARSLQSVKSCIAGCTDTALSFEPDLILFQEVDTDSTRSWHVNEEAMIRDRLAREGLWDSVFAQNYHSAYLMVPLTKPHGKSNSGLLTVARMDIESALRRSLPIATNFKKFLDLDRCYSISRFPVENGKDLVVINVHLSAYGTDASQGNAQLEMLAEDMKKEYTQGNYVICGGDFNHDFTGDSKEFFNPGTDKSYSWCNPFPDTVLPEGFRKCIDYERGMTATTRDTDIPYSKESFTVILDGFIVSDNVRCSYVQNVDTGFEHSDHNPVVMKFALEPAGE